MPYTWRREEYNKNNNKRPLTPKSMPPAGDERKTQNLGKNIACDNLRAEASSPAYHTHWTPLIFRLWFTLKTNTRAMAHDIWKENIKLMLNGCHDCWPYHHHHHHQKAFRNKSHTSHGHRPGLKRNKSKGKRLTIN